MNLKKLTIPIALALGLLTLFMLPIAWQQQANAQGPDVETASVSGTEVTLLDQPYLIMDVDEQGTQYVQISSTNSISINNIKFVVHYPEDVVRRVSIVEGSDATDGVVTNIDDDTQGEVSFILDFDTPLSTTGVLSDLVQIKWECISVSTSPEQITLVDVDIDAGTETGAPADGKTHGAIICDYTPMEIGIDPEDDQTIDIGDEVESTVIVTDVVEVWGVDFGVQFDPNVVEVVEVVPTGFLANTNPFYEVRSDTIIFEARSSSAIEGSGPIATIKWKAIAAGSSPQDFDVNYTAFLDKNDNVIETVDPIADQPETRNDGGLIIVNTAPRQLYFEDASLSVTAGEVESQDVKVSGIDGINEIQFRVTFDPDKVQVEDDDPNKPGTQITVGSLFGSNISIAENLVDNTAGTIDFRVRSQTTVNTSNSPGQIAVINWLGLTGSTDLTFVQHTLFDSNGSSIQHEINEDSDPGSITVSGTYVPGTETPTPTPGDGTPTATPTPDSNSGTTISGRVNLQGKDDNSGASVAISANSCSNFGSAIDTATTASDGTFSLDTNGQSVGCLKIERAGYLIGHVNSPSRSNIETIDLKFGDLNNNGKVEMTGDLAVMAKCYDLPASQCSSSLADVDGSGKIGILDIGLLAANYGESGPVEYFR